MTHSKRIVQAVALITAVQEKTIFSREDVRVLADMDRGEWLASGSPTFQGMRSDHPGGAPKINSKYRNIFQRVAPGKYMLTSEGKARIAELI